MERFFSIYFEPGGWHNDHGILHISCSIENPEKDIGIYLPSGRIAIKILVYKNVIARIASHAGSGSQVFIFNISTLKMCCPNQKRASNKKQSDAKIFHQGDWLIKAMQTKRLLNYVMTVIVINAHG